MNAFFSFHPTLGLLKDTKSSLILICHQEFKRATEVLHYLLFPNEKSFTNYVKKFYSFKEIDVTKYTTFVS